MEIVVKNSQRSIRINKLKIERFLQRIILYLSENSPYCFLKDSEISILLVGDRRMRKLNLYYRGKDKTTDVLSFPQIDISNLPSDSSSLLLGDIVINLHQAKRQAVERGLNLYDEIYQLLIHGLLHLLGYDHEINRYHAKKMRRLERELFELTR